MPDLGPHLLGRRPNVPDSRDWSPAKLHAELDQRQHLASLPQPGADLLDKTVRELVAEGNPFFTTWRGILSLWSWLKSLLKPHPPPVPVPIADGPLWECLVVLDQGNFGTCVGNAWAGWGNSSPVQDVYSEHDARAIYYEATKIGGSPDDPDAPGGGQQGSSTRDGVKAMKARGRLTAYAWASSIAEIEEWLDNHGPVVIGIDWTSDMFHPDPDGTVHYTGPVEGGHEIFLRQNVRTQGRKRARNSWGSGWGIGGDFFILDADLVALLKAGGDACLAAEVPI